MIANVRVLYGIALLVAFAPRHAPAQTPAQLRRAATLALKPIERSVKGFIDKRACVSCHHNGLGILVLRNAQSHGLKISEPLLGQLEAKTFRELTATDAAEKAIEARNFEDPTPNQSFLLMAASAAALPATEAPRIYAARIASWQLPDGHWATSDFRPPHSYSLFTATASALLAMQAYGAANAERLAKAREWFALNTADSTEDATFRVIGMKAAGASSLELLAAVDDLLRRQLPNGGWPQLNGYSADAYSTGEAVYALQQAGADVRARARGLRFLINTQAADGTWRTRTRMVSPANVSPEYFKTGYPYGHDEFLSFAGACWAANALLGALPEPPRPPVPEVRPPTEQIRALRDSALFGTADEFRSQMERGAWSANYTFENDLTLLMLAAGSSGAETKVGFLLSRGANARARTKSGSDALTIAASYRGNSAVLKLLLDAGAEPDLPAESKLKNSALGFASMSGDLEAVKLLLSRGADPNAHSPVLAAITSGHTEVVKTLIGAGAVVDLVESTGVNLLHWAAITDRTGIIPLLATAKVPVNAEDDNGYTPLHYAASIDFGDTQTLDALLAAGADRKARNFENRTPFREALRHRHVKLANALRRATQ